MGIAEDYTQFNTDIIIHINSVFSILAQLGAGPENGFFITDKNAVWSDYFSDANVEMIRAYVYLKVRMLFDLPRNGSVASAMEKNISELEWRINVAVDPKEAQSNE